MHTWRLPPARLRQERELAGYVLCRSSEATELKKMVRRKAWRMDAPAKVLFVVRPDQLARTNFICRWWFVSNAAVLQFCCFNKHQSHQSISCEQS